MNLHTKRLLLLIGLITISGLTVITANYLTVSNSLFDFSRASGGESTTEGELKVVISDDFENEISTTEYLLKTTTGELLKLDFVDEKPDLKTGTKVNISGKNVKDRILIKEHYSTSVNIIEPEPLTLQDPNLNEKKIAIILINFQNASLTPEFEAKAAAVTYTNQDSVRGWYDEVSYNTIKSWLNYQHES